MSRCGRKNAQSIFSAVILSTCPADFFPSVSLEKKKVIGTLCCACRPVVEHLRGSTRCPIISPKSRYALECTFFSPQAPQHQDHLHASLTSHPAARLHCIMAVAGRRYLLHGTCPEAANADGRSQGENCTENAESSSKRATFLPFTTTNTDKICTDKEPRTFNTKSRTLQF